MGNQTPQPKKSRYLSNRKRTIEPGNQSQAFNRILNQSIDGPNISRNNLSIDYEYQSRRNTPRKSFLNEVQEPSMNYEASQYNEQQSELFPLVKQNNISRVNSSAKNTENDRILQKLSKRNQQLRHSLKKISDQLTQKLKHKKFVPKKQKQIQEQDEEESLKQKNNLAGRKRQLQNAYKQIAMYKRTIENLKGKEGNEEASFLKIQRLQNQITDLDKNINLYIKKIQGTKNINKTQDTAIQKDLNDQLHYSIKLYAQQMEQIKQKLKQYKKRQQQRQVNYKKQQAYLCEIQKKYRQLNGQYYPSGDPKVAKGSSRKTASSDKHSGGGSQLNYQQLQQFDLLVQQAKLLRKRHQQYHKNIDLALGAKNKVKGENKNAKKKIQEDQKLIAALKAQIQSAKKVLKPPKNKNLFGSENYESILVAESQTLSDQQEKQKQQDQPHQFDIKHLISNIPKPIRQKPVIQQIKPDSPIKFKRGDSNGPIMSITLQKAQPKKWGTVMSRKQERGKTFKAQLKFNDAEQFDSGVQPLIVGLNIWVNMDNEIIGIQAIYLNKQDIRYGFKSSSASEGKILRFDLQRPDYVKNITGYFGKQGFIEHLVVSSKFGKSARYGVFRQNMQPFNFGLSSNQRPFLLFGGSTLFDSVPKLNKLGLQICQQEQ